MFFFSQVLLLFWQFSSGCTGGRMETQSTHSEAPEARLGILENQELESPRGVLTAELYAEFLALYLLTNDLANAKFLWKRIPDEAKTESDELKAVWEVGKAAWQRDYHGQCLRWDEPHNLSLTLSVHSLKAIVGC